MNNLDPAENEDRLSDAVVMYLESLEAGQPSNRARYPELTGFFADADAVERWTRPLRETARLVKTAASDPGGTQAYEPPSAPKLMSSFGDYQIIEELGHGGMGVVYKAQHIKFQRLVALKMILAGAHADRANGSIPCRSAGGRALAASQHRPDPRDW